MNMKKITGMLVGAAAVMSCESASAERGPETHVPMEVTIEAPMVAVSCAFAGKTLTPTIRAGDILGTVSCINRNKRSVAISISASEGTTDLSGSTQLTNSAGEISGRFTDADGASVPITHGNERPNPDDTALFTIPPGGNALYDMKAVIETPNAAEGVYSGSITIITWTT
ncbi:hypothetical protein BZG88_28725 [Salmonella enterica]|nr:hypothetical protein [Salmonella enterica]EAM8742435.1 hypothetical protein [Salmonella enterica]